ncbi:VOC family protein [Sphingomonas sp.]|uniref:VOC family protein n=1 Tax=Sphingomonas sp. TaxID=28214 RepID=UPI003CC52685
MTDPDPLAGFDLAVQPMVHVEAMGPALDFYEALGGRRLFGSRDGDWALLRFGTGTLSLLAHPPGPNGEGVVELQFTSRTPLDRIEAQLRATAPERIERGVADEAFGRMLQLRSPDGLIVKLLELDRDLIE